MATNKNQHFVPRSYLKPFTLDGEGAAINLYNVDRSRPVQNAPTKGQCSGDYFYGKDLVVERALQGIEGAYASALKEILADGYALTDEHRTLLRHFACLQHLRTEAASRRSVEMAQAMGEAAGASPEEYRMEIREAVQEAMSTFAEAVQLVLDLKVCLVRNESRLPFICSDDPAVLANRWHQTDTRAQGVAPGVASAGALLLLPLSPEVHCVIYDGDVYSIPHVRGWVTTRREADVEAFNQHQFLNCRANIYFKDWTGRQNVARQHAAVSDRRPEARHRVHYAVFDRVEGNHEVFVVVNRPGRPEDKRAMIHVVSVYPEPKAWPTQIDWRRPGRVYSNGTGTGFIRQSTIPINGRAEYGAFAARQTNRQRR